MISYRTINKSDRIDDPVPSPERFPSWWRDERASFTVIGNALESRFGWKFSNKEVRALVRHVELKFIRGLLRDLVLRKLWEAKQREAVKA